MIIRKASINDSEELLQMVYNSGQEIYDYLFKTKTNSALDYMRHEYKTGNGLCGFKNITIGTIDDKPVVVGSFFDKSQYKKLALSTFGNILSYFGLIHAFPVIFRIINIGRISKQPCEGEIYLANFSVDSTCRGKGIGTLFLYENIKNFKKKGYKTLGLDVSINNTRAEKLYSKIGLKVTRFKSFKAQRYGINIQGCKKMELPLQNQNKLMEWRPQ